MATVARKIERSYPLKSAVCGDDALKLHHHAVHQFNDRFVVQVNCIHKLDEIEIFVPQRIAVYDRYP